MISAVSRARARSLVQSGHGGEGRDRGRRLRAPQRAERGVGMPLPATDRVPRRLSVPDDDHTGQGHRRHGSEEAGRPGGHYRDRAMLLRLSWPWVVALGALAWTASSAVAGWWMARRGPRHPEVDGPVLRLRAFEQGGRWYERTLKVKRWKSRLPEAGRLFGGRSSASFRPVAPRRCRCSWPTAAGRSAPIG